MTLERSPSVTDFAISRFARLYPAFWVSVIVTTSIVATGMPEHISAFRVAVNLTMFQGYLGIRSVESVYWSLGFELGFYILIGALFASGQLRHIEFWGCVWVAIAFVAFKLFPHIGTHISWRVQLITVLPFAGLFLSGIVFYKIWQNGATIGRVLIILYCWVTQVIGYPIHLAAIVTALFVVFALCVAGRASFLASRPLAFLGTISYSLYLIHATLGFRVELFGAAHSVSPWADLVAALIVAVGAAALITFVIERPLNRAIRKAYRRFAVIPEQRAITA